jgi:signal transduction histidine kinase
MFRGQGSVESWLGDDSGSPRDRLQRADEAEHRLRQVCHDARQDLAVIAALVDRVLANHRCLCGDREDDLTAVRRVASDLATTMRDVACGRAATETVDLTALLRTVADEAALIAGATVTAVLDTGLSLRCNPAQARRAVFNLLDNARRAAGPRGWVELRAASTMADLVIEVEDSGPGFGAASQGLASLGLSVVHDWLAVTGGRMRIEDGAAGGALLQLRFERPAAVPPARTPLPR